MRDDLSDIDPDIVTAITANADAFIEADVRVDTILSWGNSELEKLKQKVARENGSVADFSAGAAQIEEVIKEKLRALEEEIRTKNLGVEALPD